MSVTSENFSKTNVVSGIPSPRVLTELDNQIVQHCMNHWLDGALPYDQALAAAVWMLHNQNEALLTLIKNNGYKWPEPVMLPPYKEISSKEQPQDTVA